MTMPRILARVERVTPLTDTILELVLKPMHYIPYIAGQYLQIHTQEEALCFSIANAPLGSQTYELHIRHQGGNPYEQPLFRSMKADGAVTLSLPYGDCHIERLHAHKPIIFVAAGTGFAPAKAMIEHLLATGDKRSCALYWGARAQSDLYCDEKVKHWAEHVRHFSYVSLLSGSEPKAFARKLLAHHAKTLTDSQIVIAGPFDRVYALRDVLLEQGVSRHHLFSDAFAFEHE